MPPVRLGKVPLRVVLVLPFVLQILAAVATVGYLTAQNRQQAIYILADQLMGEVSQRIKQNLQAHLATPSAINRTNHGLIKAGKLNLQNLPQWDRYLLEQVQVYHPTILYIGVGNPKGEYHSAEKQDELSLRLNKAQESFGFRSYEVDVTGNRLTLKSSLPDFRIRQRKEYQSVAQAHKPIWTPIFASLLQPTLLIAKADPIREQGQFQGFVVASLRLDGIGNFLHTLKVGRTGQAFVVDRQGTLLATSTGELPFRDRAGTRELIRASNSTDLLTRAAAQYLEQSSERPPQIHLLHKERIRINDTLYYLTVMPFQEDGLDWFIVIVIPESDFLTQVHVNNQATLWLCLLSVAIALLIGILTARWITRPLLELNAAAKKIASGEWQQPIVIHRQDEVGELAHSFNQMSQQLQHSFTEMETLNQALLSSKDQLAAYNRRLEAEIAERTEALEEANQELKRLATTDSLTQVANRRHFDEHLHQEWLHAIRSRSFLSLILCDVDYFKRYNDTYGHQRGDECLKQVARAIAQATQRATDLVARYGGEEFGIILPCTDLAGAMRVAEVIRTKIQELQRPHTESEISSFMTVSLGVASILPHASCQPELLIAAADAALYDAKMQGRNRACGQIVKFEQ
jgi:diguanylate cyclase (GGDEF)-like protein